MSHTVEAQDLPAPRVPSVGAEGTAPGSTVPGEGAQGSSAAASSARDTGWGALRWVGIGLLAGAGWGVVARAWMRYISDDPSFTWSGTLFIVGLAALAGLSLGVVELLRRRGARLWRLLLALPAVVMFAGPGAPMLPSAVFGGLALTGRGGWRVRVPALVLAVAPLVALVVVEGLDAFPNSVVLSLAWYVGLCAWLAVGWSVVWRRRVRR